MKKIISNRTFKNLQKHQFVIFVTIILAIIGAIQSFTWVYDRFLYEFNQRNTFEKEIFQNISPGNTEEYLIGYFGEARKKFKTKIDMDLLLWNLNGVTIGALIDEETKTINTLAIYSPECAYEILIPQINFNLCEDELLSHSQDIPWIAYVGAQDGGYVEQQSSGRYTRYLSNYYGTDLAFDLIGYTNQVYGMDIKARNLISNDAPSQAILHLREGVKPNFIALSMYDIPLESVLWDIFAQTRNFNLYND